jgi:hypothetical protein
MPFRENMNLMDMFGIGEVDDPSYVNSISDYDVAVLRSKTGQPAIAIRRAAMKVGSDPRKIEEELTAQKTNRG